MCEIVVLGLFWSFCKGITQSILILFKKICTVLEKAAIMIYNLASQNLVFERKHFGGFWATNSNPHISATNEGIGFKFLKELHKHDNLILRQKNMDPPLKNHTVTT